MAKSLLIYDLARTTVGFCNYVIYDLILLSVIVLTMVCF